LFIPLLSKIVSDVFGFSQERQSINISNTHFAPNSVKNRRFNLLVVNGNPLSQLEVMTGQGESLSVIMQGGQFHKHTMSSWATGRLKEPPVLL